MRIIPTRTPPDRGYEHDDGYQGGQDGWSPRGAYEDEDLEDLTDEAQEVQSVPPPGAPDRS